MGFAEVGTIPPEALSPNPYAPCYGASCPRFEGGVDWNAPGLVPPESDTSPVGVEVNLPGTHTALFSVATYPGGSLPLEPGVPVQQVDLTLQGSGTLTFLFGTTGTGEVHGSLLREAGENLLATAPWSSVGWTGAVRVQDGVVELSNRDGYYGGPIRLPAGLSPDGQLEADTSQAMGDVRIV